MSENSRPTFSKYKNIREDGFSGEYRFNEIGNEKDIELTTQLEAENCMDFLLDTFLKAEEYHRNKKRKKGSFRESVVSAKADVIDKLGNEYEVYLVRKDYYPIVHIGRDREKPLLNDWRDYLRIK